MRESVNIAIPLLAAYRIPLPVTKSRRFGGIRYPVCPRCNISLDREYQHFCDRCGQRLSWCQYR